MGLFVEHLHQEMSMQSASEGAAPSRFGEENWIDKRIDIVSVQLVVGAAPGRGIAKKNLP